MPIRAADVRHVALLARLSLSEEEVARFTRDLGAIVEYVDALSEVEFEDAESALRPALSPASLRNDAPRPGLTTGEALADAPDVEGGQFRVPGFLPG